MIGRILMAPPARLRRELRLAGSIAAGAVGDVAITPLDGQTLDGWSVAVKADLLPNGSSAEMAHIKVHVITTFTKDGEEPQVAISEVTLSGDGRHDIRHGR